MQLAGGLQCRGPEEEGHLSEVSGIGAKRREMLLELGIRGLSDLAAADPAQLAERLQRFGEQHAEVAPSLVAQARAQRDGRVDRLYAAPVLPELQDCPGVLYDIESDPDARHDFLHGFLVLPRTESGTWDLASVAYHPILALVEHGEPRCWFRLQRLLHRYRGWPILHYGETESLALRRMAERQGAAEAEVLQLRHRLVDVHARVAPRLPCRVTASKPWPVGRGSTGVRRVRTEPELCCGGGSGRGMAPSDAATNTACAGSSITTATTVWPPGLWPPGCLSKIRRRDPETPRVG